MQSLGSRFGITAVSATHFSNYLQNQPVERRIKLGFGQGAVLRLFTLQSSVEDNATLQ
jgi:hypothetical protein